MTAQWLLQFTANAVCVLTTVGPQYGGRTCPLKALPYALTAGGAAAHDVFYQTCQCLPKALIVDLGHGHLQAAAPQSSR